jgi:hypothetical protein
VAIDVSRKLRRDSSLRIHKVAAATLMSAMAVGSLLAAGITPAAASTHAKPLGITGFGTAVVTPATNLSNNQVVKVKASKFPKATTTLYAVECSAKAISTQDEGYCDTTMADLVATPATNGAATFNFTIHTGASFHPAKPAVCAYPHKCNIIVSDGSTLATTTTVAIPVITFKGVGTLTKVTSKKKTITAKQALNFIATTIHGKASKTHLTGKVTFSVNGHRFASVTEKATGKVSAKHVFTKAGTYHITATYSGNNVYVKSIGKETIHVKKKA